MNMTQIIFFRAVNKHVVARRDSQLFSYIKGMKFSDFLLPIRFMRISHGLALHNFTDDGLFIISGSPSKTVLNPNSQIFFEAFDAKGHFCLVSHWRIRYDNDYSEMCRLESSSKEAVLKYWNHEFNTCKKIPRRSLCMFARIDAYRRY